MSLNACSVNGSTINVLCSPARGKILNALLDIKYPDVTTARSGGVAHPAAGNFYRYHEREEQVPLEPVHMQLVVGVELFGITGTEAQDLTIRATELVTVTRLCLDHDAQAQLNITDLSLN